jgi:hypothetical protein
MSMPPRRPRASNAVADPRLANAEASISARPAERGAAGMVPSPTQNTRPTIVVRSIEDPLPFVAPGQWRQRHRRCNAPICLPLPNAYQIQSWETHAESREIFGLACSP